MLLGDVADEWRKTSLTQQLIQACHEKALQRGAFAHRKLSRAVPIFVAETNGDSNPMVLSPRARFRARRIGGTVGNREFAQAACAHVLSPIASSFSSQIQRATASAAAFV